MKLVYGVGFNDGKYPASINYKITKEYAAWRNMLIRCYKPYPVCQYPSYSSCSVSENFKLYSYFYEWYRHQVGHDKLNFDLDKDLLIKGNKVYSEENCILLPSEINGFLTKQDKLRGKYPIGVHFHKPMGKFRAQLNKNGTRCHIGYFNNIESAFKAYKAEREKYIKEMANKYRDSIDPRAYRALMEYSVEITD